MLHEYVIRHVQHAVFPIYSRNILKFRDEYKTVKIVAGYSTIRVVRILLNIRS